MKKLISVLILLLCSFSVFAQTYELRYDSVRIGKNDASSVLIPGKLWLKGITQGLNTDSLLVYRNGKVFRYAKPASGSAALTGSFSLNGSGSSGSITVTIGSTMANTNYKVFVSPKARTNGDPYVYGTTNTSTTQFSAQWSSSGGTNVAEWYWLLIPSDWTGTGGGGGGGGSGTVESVALSSTDLTISGSPITTTGTITANIATNAVTYSKLQQVSSGTLVGRGASGTGNLGAVTIGAGLALNSSNVLSATGGSGGDPDTAVYRTVANSFTKAQAQPRITLTTTGTSGAATFNAGTGALNIPIYTGGGGSGTVTSVTSANSDILITNSTTTPQLTLNAGTANNQILRRGSDGRVPWSYVGTYVNVNPAGNPYNLEIHSGGGSNLGGLAVYTEADDLKFNVAANGYTSVKALATGGTAPSITGTKKMVITDQNGLLSFEDIPSGGGGSGTVNSGAANRLAYYASSGTAVSNLAALTTNRALYSNSSGLPAASTVTDTELGYLSGVSSAIQTQLNGKQASLSGTGFVKISGSTISYDNTSYLPLTGGTLSGAVNGTTFTASGGFFDTSDMRLKTRVNAVFNASKIRSFTYKFKNDDSGHLHVGYSAQQVRLYMPDAVKKNENGELSVNYIEVLVQKVAELEIKLAKLEKELKALKK